MMRIARANIRRAIVARAIHQTRCMSVSFSSAAPPPPSASSSSSPSPASPAASSSKSPKNVLGAAQMARKANKVTPVNMAATLQLPSPSEHTAPFPPDFTSNDQREWRPRQAKPAIDQNASLLTTPIFYANGSAHIGHLSTTLLLDALNRWNNLSLGDGAARSSWLTSGTDEHGSKVAESAAKLGLPPSEHVRRISHSFHQLFKRAHIHIDDYIRTTEKRHFDIAQAVWAEMHKKGYIYLGQHSGYYSRIDECFIPESQVEERTVAATPTTPATTSFHDRETGNRVEFQSEKNYKFRLSAFRSLLIRWIDSSSTPSVIEPSARRNEVLSFLRSSPLEDISVSRLRTKVEWGIPIPTPNITHTTITNNKDEAPETPNEYAEHVMYVWLDALSNYLTLSGVRPDELANLSGLSPDSFVWPPSVQLIGKDILRFHTIYWPAFLLALNLPAWADAPKDADGQLTLDTPFQALPLQLPRQVVAHAHWLVDRTKMSKSLGNVIDPNQLIDDFGVDPVRFFILRDAQLSDDSNFAGSDLIKRFHADLADTFGNLLNRCIGAALLPENALPHIDAGLIERSPYSHTELELIDELNGLPSKIGPLMSSLRFGDALATIFTFLYRVNGYVNSVQPWTLRKELKRIALIDEPTAEQRQAYANGNDQVSKTLHLCLESVRCVGILMQPIMPDSMNKLLWRLAVPENERRIKHAVFGRSGVQFPSCVPGSSVADVSSSSAPPPPPVFVLFQKLDDARVTALIAKYSSTQAEKTTTNDTKEQKEGKGKGKGQEKAQPDAANKSTTKEPKQPKAPKAPSPAAEPIANSE